MRLPTLILPALLAATTPLVAQSATPPPAGSRIRVHTRPSSGWAQASVTHTGTLERWNADTVVIATGAAHTPIARADVFRMEVSDGRASRMHSTLKGALVGTGVGMVLGGAIGLAVGAGEHCGKEDFVCFGPAAAAGIGALVLGGGGLLVGSVIGAVRGRRGERWVRVPLPQGVAVRPPDWRCR